MKNKKLVFVLAATMLLAACGPKPAEGSSGADKPTSSVKSDGATSSNHKHSYGEWVTTKEPTCTEKGQKERTCECGEKQTQDIATVDHKYGEWKETKAPTCDADGEKERECSVCHTKETAAVITDGHKWGEPTYFDPSNGKVGYNTAICSVDQSMKVAIRGLDGTVAEGSSLKEDSAYPDSMKLNKNGHSISYKFDFKRNGSGKIYFYGAMDYWSDNSERGFYSGKNNNNETPNFTLTMNGTDVDISAKKDVPYSSMFKKGESAEHSGYTNNELIEVGAIAVTAGTNTLTFTRNESYNVLVQDFIIILDQYGDEQDISEPEKEADTWLKFTSDEGLDYVDAYIYKPASANHYYDMDDIALEAKWVYEAGDELRMDDICVLDGYTVDYVKFDGQTIEVTADVDFMGFPIYSASAPISAAGEHTLEIKTKLDVVPNDTKITVSADEHVTLWMASVSAGDDDLGLASYGTGEGDVLETEFVYQAGAALQFSCGTADGYTIDAILVNGQPVEWSGDGEFYGFYLELPAAGNYTITVVTDVAVNSSMSITLGEGVDADETYIWLRQSKGYFNFFMHGGYDAKWLHDTAGETLFVDPVFEDGYELDKVLIDGVEAVYDEEEEGYGVALSAAGNHTVEVIAKVSVVPTDTTVTVTAPEGVMWQLTAGEDEDYACGNFPEAEDKASASYVFNEQTIMIQAMAPEGYLIESITCAGVALDFEVEEGVACAMGVLPAAGDYTVVITTKQAPDTKVAFSGDDNVTAFSAEICDAGDDTLGLINWGTGEGAVAVDSSFIYSEGTYLQALVAVADGYTIDEITVNGEAVEFMEDEGQFVFEYELDDKGDYTVVIKTKQASPFTESESGEGEVEEW